jgi:hypothetical protein
MMLLALMASEAWADMLYSTDFDSTELPGELVFTEGGMANIQLAKSELRVQRDEASGNGRIRLVYDHFGKPLTDYTVTSRFHRGKGGGWTGLMVRTSTQDMHAGGYAGYHARLNCNGKQAVFELIRLGGADGTKVLTSQPLSDDKALADNATWTLSMTAAGSLIQASLRNEKDNLIAQLQIHDENFPTGTAALRAEAGAAAIYQSFRIDIPNQTSASQRN